MFIFFSVSHIQTRGELGILRTKWTRQCFMNVLKKSITFVKNTFLKRALTYNTKLKLSFNFMWRSSIYLYCIHIYSTYSIHTRSLRGATRLEFLWNWPRFSMNGLRNFSLLTHIVVVTQPLCLSTVCQLPTTDYTSCRKVFFPWSSSSHYHRVLDVVLSSEHNENLRIGHLKSKFVAYST